MGKELSCSQANFSAIQLLPVEIENVRDLSLLDIKKTSFQKVSCYLLNYEFLLPYLFHPVMKAIIRLSAKDKVEIQMPLFTNF